MCTCVYLYEFMCTICVQEAKRIQSPQTAVLGNCEQCHVNSPPQAHYIFPTTGPSLQPRHNFKKKKIGFIFNCMCVCLCGGYCEYCVLCVL